MIRPTPALRKSNRRFVIAYNISYRPRLIAPQGALATFYFEKKLEIGKIGNLKMRYGVLRRFEIRINPLFPSDPHCGPTKTQRRLEIFLDIVCDIAELHPTFP